MIQPAGEKTVAGAQLLGFGDSPIMRTGQSLIVLSSTDIGQEARDPMVGSSKPTIVIAEPGRECYLQFTVKNYANVDQPDLTTGTVWFQVSPSE